ncbi:hypothetical protein GCK32_010993 [Trichostrongylus colubriformis]|uniref:Rho-GAP domain-containing protein n=1 Tax=Trichostrongylus colubriformis TaxID=6319 RepID=A0AAN8IFQ7_TRICO
MILFLNESSRDLVVGRKWKKTKAVKQASSGTGGGASGSVGGPPSGISASTVSGISSVASPQNVLGVRLADCPTSGPDDLVPLCVQICVSVVEAHGLDTVGIYRIPGNTAAVNALKEMFSHGLESMSLENMKVAGTAAVEQPQYGVGVPSGVSAASFNDMHNLIRKANEEQAAAMMSEGKGGKIKNILRRNSRRDKSKSKLKIESTAPAAMNPRAGGAYTTNAVHHQPSSVPPPQHTGVESAFCGNYQERDIDAEIMSRQLVSPLAATSSSALEQSPSIESSLGSIPDTSRTDPGTSTSSDVGEAQARRKRQQDIYSARRIFIAGSAAAADDSSGIDALANHTQHLNMANSPALEVLSEETREKIRKMQRRQNWMDPLPLTDIGTNFGTTIEHSIGATAKDVFADKRYD